MEAPPFRVSAHAQPYRNLSRIPVSILLDRVRSLYNVGAFFRTGDAAGAEKLYLTGYTGQPPQPGISKTALGAEQTLPWEHRESAVEVVAALRQQGYEIAAVETSPRAVELYEWRPRFPICVVFGNEVDGVSPELARACDVHVRIPTLGAKQSLNVAVAGGVILYELLRRYRELHLQWERIPFTGRI